MNFFDIMNLISRVPYDVMQRLEGDIPKFLQLLDLAKKAQPHVDAIIPMVKEGETIWNSLSPDVQSLLKAMKEPQS